MTQEEFIKVLEEGDYSYRIEGDKIVVTNWGNVYLRDLTTLPGGVKFENEGDVYLNSLVTLPVGVEFSNKVFVYLYSLTGGFFDDCKVNIKGIASNRLLNLMISKGIFER